MLDFMPKIVSEKQNIAVWSQGRWMYYNVDYIEPLPASGQTIVDFLALSGGSSLAAGAQIALQDVTTFQVDEHQLLQLRFQPIDDIELTLWETRSQGKFATRGVHCRVSLMTRGLDPHFASSEFNVLGRDRDPFISVDNVSAYALEQARALFYGRKYILQPLLHVKETIDQTGVLRVASFNPEKPDVLTPLAMTYCNAEGRLS